MNRKDRVFWTVAALCATLATAAPSAWAQWKWKDRNGQVHVSDLPPPRDIPDKDVMQRPTDSVRRAAAAAAAQASAASAPVPAVAVKPRVDPELEARKARQEQEQKAKDKAAEDKASAQRAENCQRARQHVATLESGMRIARLNDKGEREILDDKARAEEMQRARQVIASECRSSS
jgi:type IV secretory pathway VirB10-like protein